jgi:hypothetical protein
MIRAPRCTTGIFFILGVGASLGACSGSGQIRPNVNSLVSSPGEYAPLQPAPLISDGRRSNVPVNSQVDQAVKKAKGLIYASSFDDCIYIYNLKGHDQPVIGSICGGTLKSPAGLAIDEQRNLWVADFNGSQILCYPQGSTTPSITLNDSGYYPTGVTTDKKGRVYVANFSSTGSGAGNVLIYAKGSTTATRTLANSNLGNGLYGIAVDKKYNIFVSYGIIGTPAIGEFTRGSRGSYTFSTIITDAGYASALDLDESGNLIAANQGASANNSVEVFSPPSWTLTNEFAGSAGASGVKLGPHERTVFVAEPNSAFPYGGALYEFSYPAGRQVNEITAGLNSGSSGPTNVAVSPRSPIGP